MKGFFHRELIFLLALFAVPTFSHILCSDTTSPAPDPALSFCTQYRNNSCCYRTITNITPLTSWRESVIQTNFTGLGIDPNSACGNIMQEIMCTKCDPWATHLRGAIGEERAVPFLCMPYCANVYSTCANVVMNPTYSPFGVSQISQVWPDSSSFCNGTFGVPDGYCFNGAPYVDPGAGNFTSNQGLCLDRVVPKGISWDFISMTVPPDNNNTFLAATRDGHIFAYNLTSRGPFGLIGQFLDLSARVTLNGEGGLLSMAYHPLNSSRFFVSYICAPWVWDDCRWDRLCSTNADCLFASVCLPLGNVSRCGCLTNANCLNGGICVNQNCMTGATSGVPNHVQMTIVAEFQVNASNPYQAIPVERQRIITASRPGANHNGGQILFSPKDGYLYIFQGDGGGNGGRGPQDPTTWMGKVLRINVNNPAVPYTVPIDNPFLTQPTWRPEVFANGLRNPWRNSFDRLTGDLWNGDVGESTIEEVNLILPGKNYGWRKFEGYIQWNSDALDPVPTAANMTIPRFYYTHQSRFAEGANGACIIGGYVYRGTKNKCFYGKYIYSDQLGAFYVASHDGNTQNFIQTQLTWACGSDSTSPLNCNGISFASIYSHGEDNMGNFYLLTDQGIVQLVEETRCPAINCLNTNTTAVTAGTTSSQTTGLTLSLNCAASIPSSTVATAVAVPQCSVCSTGNRLLLPPADPSQSIIYTLYGINGTYDPTINNGSSVTFIWADVGTVPSQTLDVRVRYDFSGNFVWERTEIFDKLALDNNNGWQVYTISDPTKRFPGGTSGVYSNLVNGIIEVTLWQSTGTAQETVLTGGTLGGLTSYIQIPFVSSQSGTSCNYLLLGAAPPSTATATSTAASTTVLTYQTVPATSGPSSLTPNFVLQCSATNSSASSGVILAIPNCDICNATLSRISIPPVSPSLQYIYLAQGLVGPYLPNHNLGITDTHIWTDCGTAISQTLEARVRFDFEADGIWDRVDIFDKWALDSLVGYQEYTRPNGTGARLIAGVSTGTYRNFINGNLELTIWQSSGTANETIISGGALNGMISWLDIPFSATQNGNPCNFVLLGGAPQPTVPPTTGVATTAVATTGVATTAVLTTGVATTAVLTTGVATTAGPITSAQIPTSSSQIPTSSSQIPTSNSQIPTSSSQIPTSSPQIPSNSHIPTTDSPTPTAQSSETISASGTLEYLPTSISTAAVSETGQTTRPPQTTADAIKASSSIKLKIVILHILLFIFATWW